MYQDLIFYIYKLYIKCIYILLRKYIHALLNKCVKILLHKLKKSLFSSFLNHVSFCWVQQQIKFSVYSFFSITTVFLREKIHFFLISLLFHLFRHLFLATLRVAPNLQFWASLLSTIRYSFTVDFTRSSHLSIRDSRFQMPQWRHFLSAVSTRRVQYVKIFLNY